MSAAWAWLVLLVAIAVYVAVFDLTHRVWTMTAQFHAWMLDPVAGPFIVGGYVAVAVGLIYHFMMHHSAGK